MAHVSVFEFRYGTSIIHRLDVRFKLILLVVLFNLVAARSSIPGLLIMGVLLFLFLISLKVSFRAFLVEIRLFWLLLLFCFHCPAVRKPGKQVVLGLQSGATVEGMTIGLMIAGAMWFLSYC